MKKHYREIKSLISAAAVLVCTTVVADQPATLQTFDATVVCVYPRTAPGQELVLCISYSNRMGMPLVWQAPFDITRHPAELGLTIYRGTDLVKKVARAYSSPPMGNGPHEQPPGSTFVRDVVIPPEELPVSTGVYKLVTSVAAFRDSLGLHQYPPLTAASVAFELVAPGTPTPERPRPWKEYDDPKLYLELKEHLLAMPIHRFEQAGLSSSVWLEVFCDSDIPQEKRLPLFDKLMYYARPHTPKLLPLALDEKTDETIRLRALMLLGGMENNDTVRKELIKRYWLKDDAGKPSALYRLAFIYGGQKFAVRNSNAIPYGTVDPSPLVRALALKQADDNGRWSEVVEIAKTLLTCTDKFPGDLFPWTSRYFGDSPICDRARHLVGQYEERLKTSPESAPEEAAAQVEAVKKLFH